VLPSLPDLHVSDPVPGQSLRPLSDAELGLPPSLWPNSMTTMSPAVTSFAISSKRPSAAKLRAERPAMALFTTGMVTYLERYWPQPGGMLVERAVLREEGREGGGIGTVCWGAQLGHCAVAGEVEGWRGPFVEMQGRGIGRRCRQGDS
jgi:hypothetical protein